MLFFAGYKGRCQSTCGLCVMLSGAYLCIEIVYDVC